MLWKLAATLIYLVLIASRTQSLSLNENQPALIRRSISGPKHFKTAIVGQQLTFPNSDEQLPASLSPEECHFHQPDASLRTIHDLNFTNTATSYHYNPKYKLIYRVNPQSLTVLSYDEASNLLTELSSILFEDKCPKTILFDDSFELAYFFSCTNVSSIQVRIALASLKLELTFTQPLQISSVLSYKGRIFCTGNWKGVIIITINPDNSLRLSQQLTSFSDTKMTAVSVTVYKDNLYVLDEKEGVLIYVLGQDNIFVFEDVLKLPLSTSSSYLQILSYNNNFFVVAKVEDESFVCEFQLQGKEYYLVRYYKHYSAINQILIIDSMLAIVASTSIDLFSFNRDPRTITSLDNGFVSYHIHSPLQIDLIYASVMIIRTAYEEKLTGLRVRGRKTQCRFKVSGTVQFRTKNICVPLENDSFNTECFEYHDYVVEVAPEKVDPYLWLVFIILAVLIMLVLLLMYWRETKVVIITKIINEIKRLKLQNSKKVQFVQQIQQNQTYKLREWHEMDGFAESDRKLAGIEPEPINSMQNDNRVGSCKRIVSLKTIGSDKQIHVGEVEGQQKISGLITSKEENAEEKQAELTS